MHMCRIPVFSFVQLTLSNFIPYTPQECATFFLESSREKIKHAIAALLVEILYPVAAVINVEASLPVIKRFVTMLYNPCFEQARKGRHSTQTVSGLIVGSSFLRARGLPIKDWGKLQRNEVASSQGCPSSQLFNAFFACNIEKKVGMTCWEHW